MSRLLDAIWYGRTIRIQLMIAIGVINGVALAIVGMIFVANARQATQVEMEATVELAKNFARIAIQSLSLDARPEDLTKKVDQLSGRLRIGKLRHVRILMADANGDLVQLSPAPDSERDPKHPPPAPKWFETLVAPDVAPRTLNMVVSKKLAGSVVMVETPVMDGERNWDVGTVVIAGEPADEIAEVWADMSSLGPMIALIDVLVLATLYVVLGRLLDPMTSLGKGLTRLEDGEYETRLAPPRAQELHTIALRFNRLAETLGRTRSENGRLYGQLVTIQEDERREIANELHDEASPCLFGIMANAISAQRRATEDKTESNAEIGEHMTEILKITDRLKHMNRVMLKKLRPVAVGRVAVSELASELIGELQKRYTNVDITHSLRTRAERYGEAIDLTVYRCIQEGVTNAIRHGNARAIRVDLFAKQHRAGVRTLQLLIQDDGRGFRTDAAMGFGLTAMRERVHALSGTWNIESVSAKGTLLKIVIPLSAARARARGSSFRTFDDVEVS
ncbi:MAG: histidine kinase [Methyloceanibacter sp.]|nr:histidine kinase [Methyloceanibacter sp.]